MDDDHNLRFKLAVNPEGGPGVKIDNPWDGTLEKLGAQGWLIR